MDNNEAREILIQYNRYNRGDINYRPFKSKTTAIAIDCAIRALGDGWVSVEDGLPEEGVPVNVYMSYGKIDVCHLRPPDWWIKSLRSEHTNRSVTHWRYLPSPPKPRQP